MPARSILMSSLQKIDVDELNSSVASYLPDRCLITFSSAMPVISKEDLQPIGFFGAKQISYFLHEWMHYLHNISTVHGISSFSSLVELWSAFRWTTDEHGISSGKINHNAPELFKVTDLMRLMCSARQSFNSKNALPKGIAPDDVNVISYTKKDAEIKGGASNFNLFISHCNRHGDENNCLVSFGPGEILESVAYMLEKIFLEHLEEKPDAVEVVPYHLLSVFARHIAPSLIEEDVLLCALASLQCTNPAEVLISILSTCENISQNEFDRKEYINKIAINQINYAAKELNNWLDRINEMFSNDEPMGLAVRDMVFYMRRNFSKRAENPFFEVDFIKEMGTKKDGDFGVFMNNLMVEYGICSGKQEFPGLEDDIGRDLIFEFDMGGRSQDINIGYRIMQASFDFIFRHFSKSFDFLPTSGSKNKSCPFYTSCDLSPRIERSENCKYKPWKVVNINPVKLCWYASGVLKLQPGLSAEVSQ